jgi:hypothetical protein
MVELGAGGRVGVVWGGVGRRAAVGMGAAEMKPGEGNLGQ